MKDSRKTMQLTGALSGEEGKTQLIRALPGFGAGGFLKAEAPGKAVKRQALKASGKAVAAGITLRGNMIQQAGWTDASAQPGIYTVPTGATGDFTLCKSVDFNGNGYDNNEGVYRGVYYYEFFGRYYTTVYTYDSKTWEKTGTKSGAEITIACTDCAMDPTTGDVYGCYFNSYGSGYVWAKADYEAGKSVKIADITVPGKAFIAVGADKDGQFYAISKESVLYKVDKATGEATEVAATELPVQYLAGGCVNDENNTFLATYCTSAGSGLCEIDLATGSTVLLREFVPSSDVIGLHVYTPAAPDKAPNRPTLTVGCTGGAMAVDYTVEMPSSLFDDTDAAGATFDWEISANEAVVASGTLAAGQSASGTADVAEPGLTTFVLTCSNEAGVSPKARSSCYIGKGVPSSPSGVSLVYDDASGIAHLSWDAVTTAADEGFFEAEGVSYSITGPSGETVDADVDGLSLDIPIEAPEEYTIYRYSVAAVYGGRQSQPVWSNKIGLGSYALPHKHDFDTADAMYEYIIVDANNDGSTWKFSSQSATGPCACYTLSGTNTGDDWMFTPAFRMEAGKIYEVTAMCGSFSTWAGIETLEIKAGKAASAEAMTMEVLPPTDLEWQTVEPVSGWVRPMETGVYTIGFHAVSKPNQWMMKINGYEVSGAMSTASPDSITGLAVTPVPDGDLKAVVSFVMPTKTVAGDDITGDVTVRIERGDEEVKVLTASAGSECSFTDNVPVKGEYTYTVTTYGADGSVGRYVSATAYIGPNEPVNPGDVKVVEAGNTGRVTVSWTDSPEDIYGNTISAANLSYNVWQFDEAASTWVKVNGEPVVGNSYTFAATDAPEEQKFVQIKVTAINRDEENEEGTASIVTAIGEPYGVPAVLSADEAMFADYIISSNTAGGADVAVGSSEIGVPASDGDDAYFVVVGSNVDDWASFMTGKFDLSEVEYPVVSFKTFRVDESDLNTVSVSVLCEGNVAELLSTAREDLPTGVWSKMKVNLSAYAGKTIQLVFKSEIKTMTMTLIDAINIADDIRNDVAVVSAEGPAIVNAGEKAEVNAVLLNDGALTARDIKVELYKNGKHVATETVGELQPAAKVVVKFENTIQPTDGERVVFKVCAVADADEVPENNVWEGPVVERNKSTYPSVSGLVGKFDGTDIALSWDETDPGTLPADGELKDFEDGTPWADEYGDWTFVDLDEGGIGGINGMEIPGHPAKSTASFWVFDVSDSETWNATFAAHSGTKYLASMYNYDDSTVDDWAISPELDGHEQVVDFYAFSYNSLYPEKIEVWYSASNSVDPSDFVKLESFGTVTVPSTRDGDNAPVWANMGFRLPEGSRRFAIRSCSTGAFMLMLDDFTYARAGGESTLRHVGYNVYRDGDKVNDEPLDTPSFVDKNRDADEYLYHVTAVYDRGESEPSEPVTVKRGSGVEEVGTDGVRVDVEGRDIVVSGAGELAVRVFAPSGQTMVASTGGIRKTVSAGVYLVTVGDRTYKIMVR